MLKKIRIKNFKSLKDLELNLGKINVIVGPNGAGKSNLVDAFILLKELVKPSSYPLYPFRRWGGYNNAVYMNDERLNIELKLEADDYYYGISVNGSNGLQVLEEELNYGNHKLVKKGGDISVDDKQGKMNPSMSIFHLFVSPWPGFSFTLFASPVQIPQDLISNFLIKFGNDIAVLRINPQAALSPVPTNYPNVLREDGFGLANIILPYLSNLPKQITEMLEELNLKLRIEATPEGNLVLNMMENINNREIFLHSSAIPWGVVKMLTIISTIEILKPSLVIIDEIENSLHLNFIERLIDELKYSQTTQAIVTTHSPMVIDLVEPSDVVMLHKKSGESVAERFENSEQIKNKLAEEGLTLSEHIFYSYYF
ncbi:AAA family ATPase [Caldisphaera sp.]|uniref:AAA family ATPase n=1 Tax=Caldisphaera sp. TaxID=2060322 RepID=UPI0025C62B0C|nr:AAA family ATPase [Caldisphaera sp.]